MDVVKRQRKTAGEQARHSGSEQSAGWPTLLRGAHRAGQISMGIMLIVIELLPSSRDKEAQFIQINIIYIFRMHHITALHHKS